MFRIGAGVAAVILGLSMVVASLGDVSARDRGGGKGGKAAHGAPAARHAPAQPKRSFAPHKAPRFSAPRRAAPSIRRAPRRAPALRAVPRASQRSLRSRQHKQRIERPKFRIEKRRQARPPKISPRRRAIESAQPRRLDTRRLQQLQQQSEQGKLSRKQRRELRKLERAQRQLDQRQARERRLLLERHKLRARHVTSREVKHGRFASSFRDFRDRKRHRAEWRKRHRAARLAARAAWKLGVAAVYVPWYGPVYWPYAYHDIFYYTFWPSAYDAGYWAYVYDDFFDGIFFPYGAPYVDYAYGVPYQGPYAGEPAGPARRRAAPGRVTEDARKFCEEQAKGIAAWPFDQIEQAVQPTEEQRKLLDDLKKAADEAAADFGRACPETVPMTPPGRLQTMTARLRATLDAVKAVRPALTAFYDSLSDEQKARFNEIGPKLAGERQRTARGGAQVPDCSAEKAGLSNLAVERIETAVRPTQSQYAALDRLEAAMQKAVDALREACPTATPATPVGRLDVMQRRLEAMLQAADTVGPALEEFYAALDDEQKAKFNRLGRKAAQSGG